MPWQLDQDLETKKPDYQAKVIFAVLFALEKREALDSLGGREQPRCSNGAAGCSIVFERALLN